jgi:acyl-CoA reductase-like NAD-dependent aldehyde dehydrogenase
MTELVIRPAWHSGEPLGTVRIATPPELDEIVDRAKSGSQQWALTPPWIRARALETAALELQARAEEIGKLLALESGKVLSQAIDEVKGAAALLRGNARLAENLDGRLLPTGSAPRTAGDVAWVERVPLGVVLVVLPFNFPVELLIEKASAALAGGNSVIVKPPEQDPLAVIEVAGLLIDAGVPEDVLQIAPGGPQVGAYLAAHPGIDAVSLTGSTAAGVRVAEATARFLRPLHLELGGNDAAIVLDDADLELVIDEVVRGRLLMNGQSCAANKRLVVQRTISSEMVDRLLEALRTIEPRHPLAPEAELGPLINENAAAHVMTQIQRALEEGAKLALGTAKRDGPYVAPHLLVDVSVTAAIAADDEVFGPVFAVIPVEDEEEAVRVANASSFALNGAVFSRDLARALSVADRMRTGGVVINGTGNYRPPFVPFGGVGMSGLGREGLGYTLEELTRPRFFVLRRVRHRD